MYCFRNPAREAMDHMPAVPVSHYSPELSKLSCKNKALKTTLTVGWDEEPLAKVLSCPIWKFGIGVLAYRLSLMCSSILVSCQCIKLGLVI